jgi:PASTA domain
MAETKTDARPISPDQAADLIRDAGKVSGLAQIGILAHADELAAVQSVRLNRESLRLARRYGSGSPEAIQAGRRIDLHKSYRRALSAEFERATVPVPPSDPAAATVYGRVFSAAGKPLSRAKIDVFPATGKRAPTTTSGSDGAYLLKVPLDGPQNLSLRVLAGTKRNITPVLQTTPIRMDKGARIFRDLRIPPPPPPTPKSDGDRPPPKTPEMPDLVGMTESDARAALERLSVGSIRVTTETAAGTAPGTVVKQRPAKGTALKSSTRVALVVSARPAVKMPDLRRMTFQQAIVRLNQLGLRIGKVTGDQGKGRITGQKPKAGEEVMPGGAVDLRLARARHR